MSKEIHYFAEGGFYYFVQPKSESKFMKLLDLLFRFFGQKDFMTEYWTTIGRTIYYPSNVTDALAPEWDSILRHELVHVAQYIKYPVLYPLTYVLGLPLPVGLAYMRFHWELEAYLTQMPDISIDEAVEVLGSPMYLWCWPKPWIRKHLEKKLQQRNVT